MLTLGRGDHILEGAEQVGREEIWSSEDDIERVGLFGNGPVVLLCCRSGVSTQNCLSQALEKGWRDTRLHHVDLRNSNYRSHRSVL